MSQAIFQGSSQDSDQGSNRGSTEGTNGLLKGLRVLEFSHTVMGPCARLLLDDPGADVVKLEPPGSDKT